MAYYGLLCPIYHNAKKSYQNIGLHVASSTIPESDVVQNLDAGLLSEDSLSESPRVTNFLSFLITLKSYSIFQTTRFKITTCNINKLMIRFSRHYWRINTQHRQFAASQENFGQFQIIKGTRMRNIIKLNILLRFCANIQAILFIIETVVVISPDCMTTFIY